MQQPQAKQKNKVLAYIGGGAGLTIIGLLIAVIQLMQSLDDAEKQDYTQSTMIAISGQQLAVQQKMVELQEKSNSPQQLEKLKNTIVSLENQRLSIQETLTPGFKAETYAPEPTVIAAIPVKTTPSFSPTVEPTEIDSNQFASLPFTEEFDGGISNEWEVLSGAPVVVNGKLGSVDGGIKPLGNGKGLVLEYAHTLPDEYSIEFDYSGSNDFELIIDGSLRYSATHSRIYWYTFKDNNWSEIAWSDPIRDDGNVRFTVSGNKYVVFYNGVKNYEIIYGSPLIGNLQIVLRTEIIFIDNLKIKSP